MSSRWSTPAEVRARVQKRWDDGTLLRAYAADEPFPAFDLPLRGPKPAEIGNDLGSVQEWVTTLDRGRRDDAHFSLTYAAVGGRLIGRNQLPARAQVTSYQQAWALLGVRRQVQELDELLDLAQDEPVARAWVAEHPLRALALRAEWPMVLAAYRWLDDHRGSGVHLREISAPGVDTKLAERHRSVLAALLGVSGTAGGFLAGLGLRAKPDLVRLRAGPGAGLPPALSEVGVRADELPALFEDIATAVVVENEITYLSVPIPRDGVAIWGRGFDVAHAGRVPWLRDARVHYWGDLDTHGFAILDQLRAYLPQTRSFLMDRQTLLEHRARWGQEPSPTHAALPRLTPEESALYEELVSDHLGERVRLEQERIDWAWAGERVPYEPDGWRGQQSGHPGRPPSTHTEPGRASFPGTGFSG